MTRNLPHYSVPTLDELKASSSDTAGSVLAPVRGVIGFPIFFTLQDPKTFDFAHPPPSSVLSRQDWATFSSQVQAQHADRAHAIRFVSGVSPGPAPTFSSPGMDSSSVTDAESARTSHRISRTPTGVNDVRQDKASSFENAVLDSMHTSTTESVLSWHHFDNFPSLRNDYSSIFQLEQSRSSLPIKQSILYPYVTSVDVDSILESFEYNVNFWYPTMSRRQVEQTRNLINKGVTPEDNIDVCVALLTMALGCASQVTSDMEDASSVSQQDARRRTSRRQMGDVYFNAALRMAYVAHLTELSASPVSGISRMESSVALPGAYNTHFVAAEEEQSSLYFLACISMRRLLNRVHQLLYAQGTGAALDTTRFPCIVEELQHQLDEWRNFLPPAFQFTIDMQPAANAASGFLRQRYLTCRSVIYRPYLMWLLSGRRGENDDLSASTPSRKARKNSACRVPSLRSLLDPDVLLAGDHLKKLLQGWQRIVGNSRSPSAEQSIRVIHEADRFIREAYSKSPRRVVGSCGACE
ncbi:hypothetical protein E4U21_005277 [Claviceps maximensis]|nr:hypothetical protein E4U21_005277 [Claviceps maximensis]